MPSLRSSSPKQLLLGPHPALDDGIDRFQVAGVGRQRQVDLVARAA